jgi:uncharacterized repeat protein (TIGR01451 family)
MRPPPLVGTDARRPRAMRAVSASAVWLAATITLLCGAVAFAPAAAADPGMSASPSSGPVERSPRPAVAHAAVDIPVSPALTLAKTASPKTVSKAGDVVTYTFLATNSGNVTLTDVKVSDELAGLGALMCDQPAPVSLPPGGALTCSAQLVVSQTTMDFGAIYNIGEVAGEAPGGDPDDESDDIAAIDDAQVGIDQRPKISLTSTAAHPTRVAKGARIEYALTLENTGNVTLDEITLSSGLKALGAFACSQGPEPGPSADPTSGPSADPTSGPSAEPTAGPLSALAPGEVRTCSASYTVSLSDAKRGKVVNELTVTGAAPYATSTSGHVTARASSSVKVVRPPAAAPSPSALPAGGGLADTGGAPSAILVVAVGLTGGGILALTRSRRKRHE